MTLFTNINWKNMKEIKEKCFEKSQKQTEETSCCNVQFCEQLQV